jgi:hypothetical protein
MNYLIAGVCFFAGMLLFAAYNIFLLRSKYPEESSEIKIISKYWTNEWAAFLFSSILMICYLLALPELKMRTFKGYVFLDNLRWVSIVFGALSQWIGIAALGVSKKYIKRKAEEIEQKKIDNGE